MIVKRVLFVGAILAVVLSAWSSVQAARPRVVVGVGIPAPLPRYYYRPYYPYRAYLAPVPVYAAPVYVQPAPVYVQPAPVYPQSVPVAPQYYSYPPAPAPATPTPPPIPQPQTF
jgi:hypothetical protein